MWRCKKCHEELKIILYQPIVFSVLAYDKDNELHKVVHDRDISPVLIACANCMNTSDNIKKLRYWEENL